MYVLQKALGDGWIGLGCMSMIYLPTFGKGGIHGML